MLKDFAKTSPVTFFSLPIIIIGLLVLSYFLYSTLLTNQINAKSDYLDRQLDITTEKVHEQVNEFRSEIPFLAEVEHFENIFDKEDVVSKKLRFKLKRLINRYSEFVDTMYVYNESEYYFLGIEDNKIEEGFGNLSEIQFPVQFANVTKIIHIGGNKSLAIIPVNWGKKEKVYLAALINVFNLIKKEANNQFIGEKSYKIIFSENLGFVEAERGEKAENAYKLPAYHKRRIVNSLLESEEGTLLHQLRRNGAVYLTVYSPFKIFSERYGLIFSVSEDDFLGPIKNKLLIIFCSFFLIIAVIIVVFIFNLRDISKNNEELASNRDELSKTLAQQSLLLENSDSFTYAYDRKGDMVYTSGNLTGITGYEEDEWVQNLDQIISDNPMNEKPKKELRDLPDSPDSKRVFEMEIIHKNGDRRILHFFEKPHYNEGYFDLVVGTARDITDSFYSGKNIKRALSMLQSQQEASVDGLLVADENLKIVSCNKRFQDMFSMTKDIEVGGKVTDILDEICKSCVESNKITKYREQFVAGTNVEIHDELNMVNGRFYEFFSAPVSSGKGENFGRIWMFRDVTNRKNEIEELKLAKLKADEGAKEKENFLSTMSHEIRTPLNAIVGFANLLLQETPREDQKDQLEPLKYSADSLLSLINDILDLTKIEAGSINFEQVAFSLSNVLNGAKSIFNQDAKEKGLKLHLTIDKNIPQSVVGDYNRLNQILFNLIGNAIKFTEKGEINVSAKVKEKSDNGVWVQFNVQDTGIGIPDEKQELIFTSFSQADSNTSRKYGGTGLGLAITKKLVDLQKGRMSLESVANVGSTFTFELFYPTNEDSKTTSELHVLPNENLDEMAILIVEDNPFNQKVAAKFLEKWNAKIDVVDSGEDALELIKKKAHELILMDLQMPGMDGYETTKLIREMKDEYFHELPIIAMSADALGDIKEKVEKAGMNDYVSKPFDPKQLLMKLANYKYGRV